MSMSTKAPGKMIIPKKKITRVMRNKKTIRSMKKRRNIEAQFREQTLRFHLIGMKNPTPRRMIHLIGTKNQTPWRMIHLIGMRNQTPWRMIHLIRANQAGNTPMREIQNIHMEKDIDMMKEKTIIITKMKRSNRTMKKKNKTKEAGTHMMRKMLKNIPMAIKGMAANIFMKKISIIHMERRKMSGMISTMGMRMMITIFDL